MKVCLGLLELRGTGAMVYFNESRLRLDWDGYAKGQGFPESTE